MNLTWTEDKLAGTGSWPRWVCRDEGGAVVGFVDSPNEIHWDAYRGDEPDGEAWVQRTSFGSREQAQTALEAALVEPECLSQKLSDWMTHGTHQTCEAPHAPE